MAVASLDLRTAADRLGVHYQTAYKWVRSGQLPAELVDGSYRLDPAAVDRFGARRSRPRSPRARRPRGGYEPLADQMYANLIEGNEREARKMVGRLVADRVGIATVIDQILAPALRRLGASWEAGLVSISVEHRASAIVERILGEHHPTPRGRRRGTVVVAALSGDRHGLPTAMAAAALRETNWHVHHLGADVPADDLRQFCSRGCDAVVLTVTLADAAADAETLAEDLEAEGTPVLVGRPGMTLADLLSFVGERTSR